MKIATKEEILQALEKIGGGRRELVFIIIEEKDGVNFFLSQIPQDGKVGLYRGKIIIESPYYARHQWSKVKRASTGKMEPEINRIIGPLRFKVALGATEVFIGGEIEAKSPGNDVLYLKSSLVPMIPQFLYFLMAKAIGAGNYTPLLREIGKRGVPTT